MKEERVTESKDYLARTAASALLILALALSGPALAQEYEYEADEGLHQEEWYDPTDWFETGEGISFESDWNDYYYGYDTYDGWFDDDAYVYDQDFDQEYDFDRQYGVAPAFGDQYDRFGEPTYDYYTEDWYDDNFDTWQNE